MAPLPYRRGELCVDVWLVWEQKLPESFQQLESPLTGRDYVVDHVHEAYHHYLKASQAHHTDRPTAARTLHTCAPVG